MYGYIFIFHETHFLPEYNLLFPIPLRGNFRPPMNQGQAHPKDLLCHTEFIYNLLQSAFSLAAISVISESTNKYNNLELF